MSQLSTLKAPEQHELDVLRLWLGRLHEGVSNRPEGDEALIWESQNRNGENTEQDLVSVRTPRDGHGKIMKWVTRPVVSLFDRLWGRKRQKGLMVDEETGLVEYRDESLQKRVSMIIAATVSSALPAVAVLGLYFEKDLLKRIGIMIGMTTAFALLLAIFSSAKNVEIFATTAA